MAKKDSNPMPPDGGEREYSTSDITGGPSTDYSAATSSPALAPAVTGNLATGSDRAPVVPNTDPADQGLDLDRPSYTGSETPPPEASALKEGELSNPLQIGGQLVQDAPFTAQPQAPAGSVPMPGKEQFNMPQADGTLLDPYPVPVETGGRHVAYSAGELPEKAEEES